MIAAMLLTKKQIHLILKQLGHKPLRETIDLDSGKYRFWETSWGRIFNVPDEDFKCADFVIANIIESINSTKPD
jgi:hypothetical protein